VLFIPPPRTPPASGLWRCVGTDGHPRYTNVDPVPGSCLEEQGGPRRR